MQGTVMFEGSAWMCSGIYTCLYFLFTSGAKPLSPWKTMLTSIVDLMGIYLILPDVEQKKQEKDLSLYMSSYLLTLRQGPDIRRHDIQEYKHL